VDPDTVSAIRYGAPSLASTQIHVTCDQRGGEAVAAACSAIRQLLRQEHLAPRNHLVMHVDPSCGLLLDFSRREGARVFPLPRGVHGPWHILAAAALLPSMFLEFDFPQFLDGARRMAARCHNTDLSANPAAILAHLWSLGRPALQAGYSALSDLARWFLALQEDADARDPLPLFVNVETPRVDFKIEGESATTLGRVVSERLEAQAAALARAGRPSLTISIKRARESDVGALVFLLLFASALARELRINAGDLPQSAEPPAPPAQNARQYLV
jgi:glucose-6-phosphate isomerase